jgi:hypothetical protein
MDSGSPASKSSVLTTRPKRNPGLVGLDVPYLRVQSLPLGQRRLVFEPLAPHASMSVTTLNQHPNRMGKFARWNRKGAATEYRNRVTSVKGKRSKRPKGTFRWSRSALYLGVQYNYPGYCNYFGKNLEHHGYILDIILFIQIKNITLRWYILSLTWR